MWISKTEYTDLIAQRSGAMAQATWLQIRINQLEQENGDLRAQITGKPQRVPTILPSSPAIFDAGVVDASEFEDMGDKLALSLGISTDDDGRLVTG